MHGIELPPFDAGLAPLALRRVNFCFFDWAHDRV